MKRFSVLFALVLALAMVSCSFAAVTKPAPASSDNFGFGCMTSVNMVSMGGTPVLTYKFNEMFKGHFGIGFGSLAGDSATDVVAKGDISIMREAGSNLYIPICVELVSVTDVDEVSGTIISAGIGAETYIRPNFSVGFDAYVFSLFTPNKGDSSSNILGSGRVIGTYYF